MTHVHSRGVALVSGLNCKFIYLCNLSADFDKAELQAAFCVFGCGTFTLVVHNDYLPYKLSKLYINDAGN